ncbi:guanylyl cyclase 1 isoform X2 [Quercus lobata]|uniref:guanylyl cyclase 1 isoform X2 n=1 Tax=Quercus lobata TaxID=97700 RepID=UPI00124828A7|nr:guanylyl cyclase 1 isoform X2 [Quercus lobata]
MWPLYFLFNKILNTDEEQESDGDCLSFVNSYPFEQRPSSARCHEAVLPRSYFVEVPHIKQLDCWDCGLACVLMVLETLGITTCDFQALMELCPTHSIWTIDLAYLLHKFNVSFSFFTITVGANPSYSFETFYKEQLPNDLLRVDTLFKKAREAGINIECRSIGGKDISYLILSGKFIAIALVDQRKLSQPWSENLSVSGFSGSNSCYTGHYVVICGYDTDADEFEIRDPASFRKNVRISSKCLEEARKCFGTDEDLLLISLEKSVKQNSPSPQGPQLPSNVNLDL